MHHSMTLDNITCISFHIHSKMPSTLHLGSKRIYKYVCLTLNSSENAVFPLWCIISIISRNSSVDACLLALLAGFIGGFIVGLEGGETDSAATRYEGKPRASGTLLQWENFVTLYYIVK